MAYNAEDYVDLKNPTAFTSVYKVNKTLGHDKSDVKKHLLNFDAYRLHHPAPKRFARRVVYSPFPNSTWGLDLAEIEIRRDSKSNYGKNYILVCIDFFDRHAWFEAIKYKRASDVLNAFKKIVERSGRKPEKLTSDYGREFDNKHFKEYCAENNIHQYFTNSPIKCSLCERIIKTIFSIIARYKTYYKTKRFVHKLRDFEYIYNNTYHRSIKTTPANVSDENYWDVYEALYGKIPKKQKPTLAVGTVVLKRNDKPIFTKGYAQTFDKDFYTITQVKDTNPPTYLIKGTDGQLKRAFYRKELLPI